ncbi:MAG: cysteine--tRNA ligase, partial [Candidatus Woesearchaeota archaeon]
EAATDKKPWVKYWLHGEFLVLEKEKMAKSAGNFITLSILEEKGFSPLDYRYFCLGTHYRKQLVFSYEALEGARNAHNKLKERVLEIKSSKETKNNKKIIERYEQQFLEEVNNDLNTPQALATLWEVLKDESLSDNEKYNLILDFDRVLGLGLDKVKTEKISPEVLRLAKERETARKNKEWSKSDLLRDKIKKMGYLVEDSPEGFKIRREV